MSLRNFLEKKEIENQTIYVKETVSPHFEISSTIKDFDRNGPILFFDKVKGYKGCVVANVCGTRERLSTALSAKPENLYSRLIQAWKNPSKPKTVKNLKMK